MKILVAGGNGRVGSLLAERLRTAGNTVLIGARETGFDAVTGDGVGAAMAGVDTVVDVLNTPEMDAAAATAFFRGSTQRLLAAELSSGVRHHVLLSVVGADRALANGYYVGKVEQEDAVREGDVPFTIVRATQFHEYVPTIADWLTHDGSVEAPAMLLQPVALDDVVRLLAEVAQGEPRGGTIDVAGPERYRLDDLLRATLAERGDPRTVVTVEGTALGAEAPDSLVPLGEHRIGSQAYPVTVPTTGD